MFLSDDSLTCPKCKSTLNPNVISRDLWSPGRAERLWVLFHPGGPCSTLVVPLSRDSEMPWRQCLSPQRRSRARAWGSTLGSGRWELPPSSTRAGRGSLLMPFFWRPAGPEARRPSEGEGLNHAHQPCSLVTWSQPPTQSLCCKYHPKTTARWPKPPGSGAQRPRGPGSAGRWLRGPSPALLPPGPPDTEVRRPLMSRDVLHCAIYQF